MNGYRVLIGCARSGVMRRAFAARGFEAWECDLAPTEDDPLWHIQGDVREVASREGIDFAVFHPDCTYLTGAAAWAFRDPDFTKYPGVGYHQKIKPDTLVGQARRDAREEALGLVQWLLDRPYPKAIENPVGAIGSTLRKPTQKVQPYEFGDDASKGTCFWIDGAPPLKGTAFVKPRYVCGCGCGFPYDLGKRGCPNCKGAKGPALPRWSNQTDSGQNRLSPGEDRWMDRSRTFPGIAIAAAQQWGDWLLTQKPVPKPVAWVSTHDPELEAMI